MKSLSDYPEEKEFKNFSSVLQSIEQEVRQYVTKFGPKSKKRAVLLLGLTGSGKTTILNLLMGVPHEYREKKIEHRGETVTEMELLPVTGGLKSFIKTAPFKTSSGATSETKAPNFYVIRDVLVVDCPGFGDNRGWTQSLANSFLIEALFNHFEGVQILFIENSSNLTENRCNVLFDNLISLFGLFDLSDIKVLAKSLNFVFTKGKPLKSHHYYLMDMMKSRKQYKQLTVEQFKEYESLFDELEQKKSLIGFSEPPINPLEQPKFFNEFTNLLWNKIENTEFMKLKPARLQIDSKTQIELMSIRNIALNQFEFLLVDMMTYLGKVENEGDIQACLTALKLNCFFLKACDTIASDQPQINNLSEEKIEKFKRTYAEKIPKEIKMATKVMEKVWRLSLCFSALLKASIKIESCERYRVLENQKIKIIQMADKIKEKLHSKKTYLNKNTMVGGGVATTGAIGTTAAVSGVGATLASAFLAPIAVLGFGNYAINTKMKKVDEEVNSITPESIFEDEV